MTRSKLARRVIVAAMAALLPLAAQAATGDSPKGKNDETQIRTLLDDWAKAFRNRDIKGIMAQYAPGPELVAYDIIPPLQYVGYAAYKKDYETFLSQFKGPIAIEYRDIHVVASDTVAFAFGLERLSGTLTNGQKSDMWTRFTSGYRKINGRWYDVHDHVSVPSDLDSGKAMTALTP